jgi:tetratricopeptide (TPR) repeat protein
MRILLLFFTLALFGCDTASKAKPYAALTQEEKAREALDAQDYETAIELFQELVEGEPEEYERYRYLAAAYAASAGFDIIEVAKGDMGGGSGSLLDTLGSFLPADPTPEQLERMELAKDTLLAIPAELRSKDNTEVAYSSGAAVQLEFYQSAYTIMYINRFAQVTPEGQLDPARLESMSDEDVTNILSNFSQVAAAGGEGVPAAAQNVLSQIDQQEGATQREKLINYLNASKK